MSFSCSLLVCYFVYDFWCAIFLNFLLFRFANRFTSSNSFKCSKTLNVLGISRHKLGKYSRNLLNLSFVCLSGVFGLFLIFDGHKFLMESIA